MKEYPSIQGSMGNRFIELQNAYIFDKLDGRNVRVEWSKKRGYSKWGTRHHLFDAKDSEYGIAIPIFESVFAESLEIIATSNRWTKVTYFLELWQPSSLAGVFVPNEAYNLTLFDVAPDRECILSPSDFRSKYELCVPTPKLIKIGNWTREFVGQVKQGRIEGITFEGVVGKAGERHKLRMTKAKTQKWIDSVMAKFGNDGAKIIES